MFSDGIHMYFLDNSKFKKMSKMASAPQNISCILVCRNLNSLKTTGLHQPLYNVYMGKELRGIVPNAWEKDTLCTDLPVNSLTLYGPNSFFRCFLGHCLRYALFVYRLIGATLIDFFMIPF